ncbi:MAG: hypothetical protein HZA17_11820 [Nitrospirae bacterium]|nr:hypothetical protein [Nitrospirota bacterium]
MLISFHRNPGFHTGGIFKKGATASHLLFINVERMLIVCSLCADALEVPKLQGYVSDYADMISSETKPACVLLFKL